MAKLSLARDAVPLLDGLKLFSRGKIRDTYLLEDQSKLLVVPSNGISIFDFVLNALVPKKGMILNAMNHFWNSVLTQYEIRTHLVAVGYDIDHHLPKTLQGLGSPQSTGSVVERLIMHPIEFIGRTCLTGTGLNEYNRSGSVCGHQLPSELQDGDQLPYFLDTPTTKAEEGHDEALDAAAIRKQYPEETYRLLQILQIAFNYARQRGIVLADTKVEFGLNEKGESVLGDESLTPDSSRYWDAQTWEASRKERTRKAPSPSDKQLVRAWGIEQGINKLDPSNPDHVKEVHRLQVPERLIRATTQTYRYIFWRLTGMRVEDYVFPRMNGPSLSTTKRLALVFGSESDIKAVPGAFTFINAADIASRVKVVGDVVSCHRNPSELGEYVDIGGFDTVDGVIAVGGEAFALPGVLDALLYARGVKHNLKDIPVIGIALGQPHTRPFDAACLSIERVPGQPIIMDEVNGKVYTGEEGLRQAIERFAFGELPPSKPRTKKLAQFDLTLDQLQAISLRTYP